MQSHGPALRNTLEAPKILALINANWNAWSECVSTTDATSLMLCLALPP